MVKQSGTKRKKGNMVSHDSYLKTRASQEGDTSVEMIEEH